MSPCPVRNRWRLCDRRALLVLAPDAAPAFAANSYMINLGPVARTNAAKVTTVGRDTADITTNGNKLTI